MVIYEIHEYMYRMISSMNYVWLIESNEASLITKNYLKIEQTHLYNVNCNVFMNV